MSFLRLRFRSLLEVLGGNAKLRHCAGFCHGLAVVTLSYLNAAVVGMVTWIGLAVRRANEAICGVAAHLLRVWQ